MANEIDELRAAIELSRLPGVGAKVFRRLLAVNPSPLAALKHYLETLGKTKACLGKVSLAKAATEDGIKQAVAFVRRGGGGAVYGSQADYPALLALINEPPPVLFFRGALPRSGKALAVVGSRCPSAEAEAMARRLVHGAVELGWEIVSGGARGIDSVAHRAALEKQAPTYAVLGCGVDQVYPPEHAGLFREIVERGGGLVSELLPGAPPRRGFFPTRNRIIAGLCRATIVIQAAAHSGSLITARCTRQAKRALAALEPLARDPAWEGNVQLREEGAVVLRGPSDLAGFLAGAAKE